MKRKDWERVFILSKINGAPYVEPPEPQIRREWPKETFLRKRLAELKRIESEQDR